MDNLQKYTSLALNELQETFNHMTESQVDEVIESIHEARKVFLLGVGREGLSMKAFAMRIAHLGKETHWIWNDTTTSMNHEDLFIVVCGGGDLSTTNVIVENAKKAGTKIILFTCAESGRCVELANVIVKIPAASYRAKGALIYSQQLMGNLFEQTLFILFDVIIMIYCENYSIQPEELEARHRNIE